MEECIYKASRIGGGAIATVLTIDAASITVPPRWALVTHKPHTCSVG